MIEKKQESTGLIYLEHSPELLGYIRGKVHDEAIAEDILHDVFEKAQLNFNKLKETESLAVSDHPQHDHRLLSG